MHIKSVNVGVHQRMRDAYGDNGLTVDYIGSAQVGQWLAVEPDVIKTGSTICFAQCFVKVDDVVIARANATFRVVRQIAQTPASDGRP
jgi:acyl-coenzyme A thioesterase PaaI-like protein